LQLKAQVAQQHLSLCFEAHNIFHVQLNWYVLAGGCCHTPCKLTLLVFAAGLQERALLWAQVNLDVVCPALGVDPAPLVIVYWQFFFFFLLVGFHIKLLEVQLY
jgi:hypothetical protein